ncbi:CBO0543 family protein [Mangrovibacillus cuniculi]|uniref:Permease n=1 Tax=Mangrovibacillus cuniculi TaxID=2593652 RepID=A0A7S8HGC1_9BACI|nr:CBO0543 family protein [Mangrovibacillus cuniculi]QPC47285.1 hypothetical protein G8O30_10025 [Mangrovibacillus cuniculi]
MSEKKILRGLVGLGVILLVVIANIQKKYFKNWIIVYFFVAFTSSAVDALAVSNKRLRYPVRLLGRVFKISVLFDGLLFPITCVLYNQWTFKDTWTQAFYKVFAFTIPMTIVEHIIERKTRLIDYRGWNTPITFISLTCYFWFSRAFLNFVTRYQENSE